MCFYCSGRDAGYRALSDLSLSITAVRDIRSDVPPLVLIEKTWETFNDKKALAAFRGYYTSKEASGWDEDYVSNIFLARLCNLKIY